MGAPARMTSRVGFVVLIPTRTASVTEIRTSSTRSASASTAWVSADAIPEDDWEPDPVVEEYRWSRFPEWHKESLCRSIPIEDVDRMFFGETGDRVSLTITDIRETKAFCKTCPVFAKCLTHALTEPEHHGIWAGTSKRTRMRILTLVNSGQRTVEEVVSDYLEGRERQYESIRDHS